MSSISWQRRFVIVLFVLTHLALGHSVSAQSGRGLMHGYVAFEDISYNEVTKGAVHAKIELFLMGNGDHAPIEVKTNERGSYDFPSLLMGEYTLRISAPGFAVYETKLYIPSDFECHLAIMLKREAKQ